MHGCCDADAMISLLGIGGITSNPSQINSQASKKSGKQIYPGIPHIFTRFFMRSGLQCHIGSDETESKVVIQLVNN